MELLDKLKKYTLYFAIPIWAIFLYSTSFAGSTGKIGGKIIDARSGEALIGANVVILNAGGQGAASDINGEFLILNVPPNTYTIRISMIGYKSVKISDIRVFIDRTVKIDVDLEEQIFEGEEVVIVAKREAVEMDRTNTAAYVNAAEIKALPVNSISDVIQLQAGVVKGAGGELHIRGGRSREIAYVVDGISVTDAFSQGGGTNVNVETNMVSELQVITGTFNAEYGSAQSGIINIVTKVPEQEFSGNIEVRSGGFYSPNSQQYVGGGVEYDPINNLETRFSFSTPFNFIPKSLGKLGLLVNGRLSDEKGYLKGERRFMPEDGWEIAVYREWYQATFDPIDPLIIPIPESLHTGDGKIVSMNWEKNININAKLVYQPFPGITASYSIYAHAGEWKSFNNRFKFSPDAMPQKHDNDITHIFVLTHLPADNIYYNLRYSYQYNDKKRYMYENADDPRYQATAVGVSDPNLVTGYSMGGLNSWGRETFDQQTHLFNGDLTWQINNVIELKAGGELKSYTFNFKNAPMRGVLEHESLQFPFTQNEIRGFEMPYETFRQAVLDYEFGNVQLRETSSDLKEDELFYTEYTRKPIDGFAYAQTTLNMGEIVLNAGVRLDSYWANDRYAPTYYNVFPEEVGHDRYYKDVQSKYQLSPRFGLSFPISATGAMRLSYGHFFQAPSYEKMYDNPVLPQYNQFSIAGTTIGNPNLKAERTIQYEIGVQQEIVSDLSMELSVFYKDISDLLGVELLTLSNATTFRRYINKEYGNSYGITFALNYRSFDGVLVANIDYTYMSAKGTSSNPNAARDVQILSGSSRGAYTLAAKRIGLLDWDQRHSFNATMGYRPTKKTNVSFIARIGSALPYTPTTVGYGIPLPDGWWHNIDRKPFSWNVDMRLSQGFELMGLDFMASLNVFNLFNHLEERKINSITGQAGPNAYLPEIGRIRYSRIDQIGEFTHDEADYDPSWYVRPRFIQFALALQF